MRHGLAIGIGLQIFVSSFQLAQAVAGEPLKVPIVGLVSMGSIEFHRHDGGLPDNSFQLELTNPSIFDAVVINVTWQQLEPQEGDFSTTAIDNALSSIASYNADHRDKPLSARLRVWPGPNAPQWAKTIGGPPVTVLHKDIPVTVGRFWTEEYRRAWRALQDKLAQKYDANRLIREVTMTSCSSITDEPFVMAGDSVSLRDLHEAGFTDSKFQACIKSAATDYSGWIRTAIEFPFNPYRALDTDHPRVDIEVTLNEMDLWRHTLGARGVLSSHSLGDQIPPRMSAIYEHLTKLGRPIALQLVAPKGIDIPNSLRIGVDVGAESIEVWPASLSTITPEQLKEWSREIGRRQQ
jgi:hypothetical protein